MTNHAIHRHLLPAGWFVAFSGVLFALVVAAPSTHSLLAMLGGLAVAGLGVGLTVRPKTIINALPFLIASTLGLVSWLAVSLAPLSAAEETFAVEVVLLARATAIVAISGFLLPVCAAVETLRSAD